MELRVWSPLSSQSSRSGIPFAIPSGILRLGSRLPATIMAICSSLCCRLPGGQSSKRAVVGSRKDTEISTASLGLYLLVGQFYIFPRFHLILSMEYLLTIKQFTSPEVMMKKYLKGGYSPDLSF